VSAVLAVWVARTDYAVLFDNLGDHEAGQVVAVLDELDMPYRLRAGGMVAVPADKVVSVRIQLAGRGIPAGGAGAFSQGVQQAVPFVHGTYAGAGASGLESGR
jgi:flagellar M-ring protein FliF